MGNSLEKEKEKKNHKTPISGLVNRLTDDPFQRSGRVRLDHILRTYRMGVNSHNDHEL